MNPASSKVPIDHDLAMKILQEEGISEIYVTPQKTQVATEENPKASPLREKLIVLRDEVKACTKCSELASARQNTVFGAGNIKAKLMFVGEAPGRDEDIQGLPFVGRAGQLLTKIIESIGFTRRQVFIANVLKCRPPNNRTPIPDEIMNCEGYLQKQIEWIRPKIICALGKSAAFALLKTDSSMTQLRGKFFDFGPSKLVCTYHPAYLLRNPADKRKVWEDMKMIKRALEEDE